MTDLWITVPNWDKFQHYRDRTPVWIKLYLELRDKPEWLRLSYAQRGLIVSIWLEFGAAKGPFLVTKLGHSANIRTRKEHLTSLVHAGFIEVSASKPLAVREEKKKRGPAPARTRVPAQEEAAGWPRDPLPTVALDWMRDHGLDADAVLQRMDSA